MSDKPFRRLADATLIPSPRAALVALVSRRRSLRLFIAALILAAVLSAMVPAFATEANLVTMLADASVTGIATIGLFLVILSGGMDLSIGGIAALAPLLGGLVVGHPAAPLLLVLTLAAGGVVGLISGSLIVGGGLAAFAVTLAVDAMVRGAAKAIAATPGHASVAIDLLPNLDATWLGMPASLALLAAIASLTAAFLYGFRGGHILVAIGSDREAARTAGLSVGLYGVLPYVVSGVLAGIAGLLSATAAPSSLAVTELGGTLTLDALAAVVIGGASLRGGRGTLPAVLMGVAVVMMLRGGLSLLEVSPLWQGCAIGGLLLAGLIADRLTDPRRDR